MLRTFKIKAKGSEETVEIVVNAKLELGLTAGERYRRLQIFQDRIVEHVLLPSFYASTIQTTPLVVEEED